MQCLGSDQITNERAAGFFDGEGIARIEGVRGSVMLRIKLAKKHDSHGEWYLEHFQSRWGGKLYPEKRRRPNPLHNPASMWSLREAAKVLICLEDLSPLYIKSEAARLCREMARMLAAPRHRIGPEEEAKRRELYLACKAVNLRGRGAQRSEELIDVSYRTPARGGAKLTPVESK
ncbi:MAG: hypothetical protein DMG28_16240 [Acidobacteria bacterium]|nr:MAG: hypothetical protein DMG28_16240 [Acidobacteriota bacterium]